MPGASENMGQAARSPWWVGVAYVAGAAVAAGTIVGTWPLLGLVVVLAFFSLALTLLMPTSWLPVVYLAAALLGTGDTGLFSVLLRLDFSIVWVASGLFLVVVLVRLRPVSRQIASARISFLELLVLLYLGLHVLSVIYSVEWALSARRVVAFTIMYVVVFRLLPLVWGGRPDRLVTFFASVPVLIGSLFTILLLVSPPVGLLLDPNWLIGLFSKVGYQRWEPFVGGAGSGLLAALQIIGTFALFRLRGLRLLKALSLLSMPAAAIALLFSGSRTAVVVLLVGMGGLAWMHMSRGRKGQLIRRLLFGAVVITFGVFLGFIIQMLRMNAASGWETAMSSFMVALSARLYVSYGALLMALQHPLGYGAQTATLVILDPSSAVFFNTFPGASDIVQSIDNSFAASLLDLGLIGFGLFITIIVTMVRMGIQLRKNIVRDTMMSKLVENILVLLICLLVASWPQNAIGTPSQFSTQLFYLIGSAFIVLSKQVRAENHTRLSNYP